MNKRLLTSLAVICAVGASSVGAAELDFIEFSDNNEQGVTSGTSISDSAFDGVTLTFSAGDANWLDQGGVGNFFPYFDHGGAGLGVCQQVNSPGTSTGTGNQCNTAGVGAGDDNVTTLEAVAVSWGFEGTLSNVLFTGEGHVFGAPEFLHLEDAGDGNKERSDNTFLFGTSASDGLTRYTFGEFASLSFSGITGAIFVFDDVSFDSFINFDDDSETLSNGLLRNSDQFYLAAATLEPVPVPAALPLLLAGIGGLGFVARRKRKTA